MTAIITVSTPFGGTGLKFIWDNNKVRVRGTQEELMYWNSLNYLGMYGKYGHIVDFQNTPISDVIVALRNRVPPSNMSLNDEALAVKDKEDSNLETFPKGAAS